MTTEGRKRTEGCNSRPRNAKEWWLPPEARRRQGSILPNKSEGAWLSDILILDFYLPEL